MLHQVGAGALGPVLRAYDAEHDRLVAIKRFTLDLPPERVHQFVAELERLVITLPDDGGITRPLAAGLIGTQAYFIQEFVAADSLDVVWRDRGATAVADGVRIARHLAGALDAADAVQIGHGALHPRDVLVADDVTRLTGLGIGRALERVGVTVTARRPYTAPERLAGHPWDRRADVFSLAAVIHETLWGRRISGVGPQVSDALTDLSGASLAGLRETFERALAEDPVDRFESTTMFVDALERACQGLALVKPGLSARRGRHQVVREEAPRLPLEVSGESAVAAAMEAGAAKAEAPHDDADDGRAKALHYDRSDGDDGGANRLRQGSGESAVAAAMEAGAAKAEAPHDDADDGRAKALPYDRSDDELPLAREPAPTQRSVRDARPIPNVTSRGRGDLWPMTLALIVGAALGFAGGYTVAIRHRPLAVASSAPSTEVPAPARAGPDPVADRAVPPPPPASAPKAEPQTPAPKAEPRASGARSAPPVAERKNEAGAARSVTGGRVTAPRAGREKGRARAPAAPATAPSAQIAVESRPAGAQVFVDGKLRGTTPLILSDVTAGEHTVRIEREGYRRWLSAVRVSEGDRSRVTASLER